MTAQRAVRTLLLVIVPSVPACGPDSKEDDTREEANPAGEREPLPRPQRAYSADELRHARAIALWNLYPSIDVGALDELIQRVSSERQVPATELYRTATVFLKDIGLVPDERKFEELKALLLKATSPDASVRARYRFRVPSPNLYYEGIVGVKALHFPLLNYTGRPVYGVRGQLVIAGNQGDEYCRLPVAWQQPMEALGAASPDCYTLASVPSRVDAIVENLRAIGELRAEFVTKLVVYEDGDAEDYRPSLGYDGAAPSRAGTPASEARAATARDRAPVAGPTDREFLARVKRQVEGGAAVDHTSLSEAAQHGRLGIVEFLIAHGADVKSKHYDGGSPLFWAVEGGHVDVARVLLRNGADINAKDNLGWTPLHQAAIAGHYDMVVLLLGHGAKVNIKDNLGLTALDDANDIEIENVLKTHGAKRGRPTLPAPR